ncbi:MAG: GNAT family N-acetyltransferase [Croceibacterium sp.]
MDDLNRIMAVMDAAFDPAFGEAWTRGQVGDTLIVPGTQYLLADNRGEKPAAGAPAVGFSLSRMAADEEELLLLAVEPGLRGHGIGSRLLERVIDAARRRGVGRMFLEMRDGNLAESLYRRHGFAPAGRRRHYYRRGSDGPYDAITFSRTL